MSDLSHNDILAMMEPVGLVWVNRHAHGIDVEITVHDERPGPCVYAWVAGREIIYIGKAGDSLAKRMAQHRQGMRSGRGRGAEHADYLAALTDQQIVVDLWALWPDPLPFGGTMIPSHSSVEDYLLSAIQPKPVRNR